VQIFMSNITIGDNYNPITSLRHYPINMDRFGKNPFGENMYRIVFAPTRKRIITGVWADGYVGPRWRPTYRLAMFDHDPKKANDPDNKDCWVMERWLSAKDFTGVTAEVWEKNAGFKVLGPYPARGEYELCHVFVSADPDQCNLDKLVSWVEEGRKRSFQDHRDACAAEYEQEEKDTMSVAGDRLRDALPAFLDAPMVGFGGGRGSKTANLKYTAPLVGNNKFMTKVPNV
jgi:hypothetical protein